MNRTLFSDRVSAGAALFAVLCILSAMPVSAQSAGEVKVPPAAMVPAAVIPAAGVDNNQIANNQIVNNQIVNNQVPVPENILPNDGNSAVPAVTIEPVEPLTPEPVSENDLEAVSGLVSVENPPAEASPKSAPHNEAGEQSPVDSVLKSLNWTGSELISSTVKVAVLFSILSLVPAILMMTTSFVRIITVLSILRQGLGTGQIPPTQVLTAIAVFLTLLVMTPTFSTVWDEAVKPYSEQKIDAAEALRRGEKPVRTFLWKQIERSGNSDAVWLFMRYVPGAETPKYYEDIPWRALLPAFMLSELKVAFLIGFQILLPFLVIDLVVSGVMVSMGMMMLPPAVVTLPLKLLLFVLADGWTLVVRSLLDGLVIGS